MPQKTDGAGAGLGAQYGSTLTLSFDSTASSFKSTFELGATMWTGLNNYAAEGNRVSFPTVASGGTINIVGRAPVPGYQGFACPADGLPNQRCIARTNYNSGITNGVVSPTSSITIEVSTGAGFAQIVHAALHELFHAQGAADSNDSRSMAHPVIWGNTELTLCDAETAGRFAKQKGRASLPDPCFGRECLAPRHPQAPPCYYGSLPNGACLPDPRYKHPPGGCDYCAYGVPPIGLITTSGSVPSSGSVAIAAKDLDGMVTRVDWYAYGPGVSGYVYTSVGDPFALPYANIAAGSQYSIYALVWDDVDKTVWVGPSTLNISSGGGGSGGTAWLPNHLFLLSQATGLYTGAQGWTLVANHGSGQTLTAQDLGGGYYALRAPYNGYYVAAEGGGGGAVNVNRDTVAQWERFYAVSLGGSDVAFRTFDGAHYLTIDMGSGVATATATTTEAATRFTFAPVP